MEEIIKKRATLDTFSEQDVKEAWEIFQDTNLETEKDCKEFLENQAEMMFDLLRRVTSHAYCCPEHGEGDFNIASLIIDFLGFNGAKGAVSGLVALLNPKVLAVKAIASFILGLQFGVFMERSKVDAAKSVSELEKMFGYKNTQE
jgi:hypothetical protein